MCVLYDAGVMSLDVVQFTLCCRRTLP